MMEEVYAMNKPPMFKRANYDYWKERMIAFFESDVNTSLLTLVFSVTLVFGKTNVNTSLLTSIF